MKGESNDHSVSRTQQPSLSPSCNVVCGSTRLLVGRHRGGGVAYKTTSCEQSCKSEIGREGWGGRGGGEHEGWGGGEKESMKGGRRA